MGRRRASGVVVALGSLVVLAGCFNPSGNGGSSGETGSSGGEVTTTGQSTTVEPTTGATTTESTVEPTTVEPTTVEPTTIDTSGSTSTSETTMGVESDTIPPDVCGNREVEPGEACDDGNNIPGDGCEPDCTFSACGDGLVDGGEECDDITPDCTPGCLFSRHYVFVTSGKFEANLGGVAGADLECNKAAQGLFSPQRKFVAWLAGPDPVTDRLVAGPFEYTKRDGTVVADSYAGLVSGTLMSPIDQDENGSTIAGDPQMCSNNELLVWTGSDAMGGVQAHCAGWVDAADGLAQLGVLTKTDSAWSAGCQLGCDGPRRLYCVETMTR